ncbi:MAG: phosphatase PAP2 family protein [Micavibrio sp.]
MNFIKTIPGLGIFLLILVYMAGVYGVALHLERADRLTLLLYSTPVIRVSVMLFLFFVGWRVYSLILFERPQHLTRRLISDIKARLFTPAQLKAAIPVFIAFILFMSAFTSMKGMIPVMKSYMWDVPFMELDRTLHGGIDPWRILQPIFGYPLVTAALNIVYNLWFVVMFAVLYWQLFDLRRPQLRQRFFWAFFLSWMINGSVLAVLWSSAGPCFYDLVVVGGENPFAAQMEYLRSIAAHYPVWAVQTQDLLWQTYENNATGLGSGISAMPSVHVAIAFLFVFLGFHYKHRAIRWFFIIFAGLILIGSVHLAWHYAVDGYVGILVMAIIWWLTGLFFKAEKAA